MIFTLVLILLDVSSCSKKGVPTEHTSESGLFINLVLPNVAASGSIVQIQGRGFGDNKESVQVKFGDVVAQVFDVTDGSIEVEVPSLADGSKVAVLVLVNGVASNAKDLRVRMIDEVVIAPKDTLEWVENKPSLNAIVPGITSYNEQVVKYIRNGQQLLEVELGQPVEVAVADRDYPWGFYNFPNIRRSVSGQLHISWSMNHDEAASYGLPPEGIRDAVSNDGGATWTMVANGPIGGGTVLSNGDRVIVTTPRAVPLGELTLPTPIATLQDQSTYNRVFRIYRYDDLPAQLRGTYQARIRSGQTSWAAERGTIEHPNLARYADGNLFPVIWWGDIQETDDAVYTGTYPAFEINSSGGVDPSSVFFYKSTDFGRNWVFQGKIPYQPDLALDPNGSQRITFGWTEPAFAALKNGTFLSVLRTQDGFGKSPMYVSSSANKGISWATPKVFTGAGVLPKLLELDNGVVALSAGRPGVQLRFMLNDNVEDWTEPFEFLPWVPNEAQVTDLNSGSSCGYTGILKVDENSFLIVYSDFKHQTSEGLTRKAIKVRKVTVKRM